MNKDIYEKYLSSPEVSKKEKSYAWYTAIGLQAVDGLKTSKYLEETAIKNLEDDITFDEANNLIIEYYKRKPDMTSNRYEEADKVAIRIAQILSEKSFVFSPVQYVNIHKRLFDGIYDHAGKIRDYNIAKKEWVLNGDTVIYGAAFDLKETLEYDIGVEKSFSYQGLSKKQIIKHLATFISRLWQIHIFGEGNTRTTAVFFILYLRTLGYNVTNDIFANNAWYFRNAMVRANYSNIEKNIYETTEYLELFLENLLMNKEHDLKNRYLNIDYKTLINDKKPDIEDKKPDIEDEKPYIEDKKLDIDTILSNAKLSIPTKNNIKNIYTFFKDIDFFGRNELCEKLNLSSSTVSEIIKKMLKLNIIVLVTGKGKGKYTFKKDKR